jgi:hypothetical protein
MMFTFFHSTYSKVMKDLDMNQMTCFHLNDNCYS